jgi:hypothetical protein
MPALRFTAADLRAPVKQENNRRLSCIMCFVRALTVRFSSDLSPVKQENNRRELSERGRRARFRAIVKSHVGLPARSRGFASAEAGRIPARRFITADIRLPVKQENNRRELSQRGRPARFGANVKSHAGLPARSRGFAAAEAGRMPALRFTAADLRAPVKQENNRRLFCIMCFVRALVVRLSSDLSPVKQENNRKPVRRSSSANASRAGARDPRSRVANCSIQWNSDRRSGINAPRKIKLERESNDSEEFLERSTHYRQGTQTFIGSAVRAPAERHL